MLVFVDESEDTGFKFGQGSSDFFAVALVIFGNDDEATRLNSHIDALRAEMHLPLDYEFHFVRNNVHIRREFLKAVRDYDFQYAALVADKRKLSGPEFRNRASFYKAVCGAAFENARDLLFEANVKFDDSGDKTAKRELASYLRRKINRPEERLEHVKKVGTQGSKGNNLIQVADMICGAVYRSFQPEGNAGEYRNLIKRREVSVLDWPG